MYRARSIVGLILMGLLYWPAVDQSSAQDLKYPLRVGVILPLSGGFAAYGTLVKKGIESSRQAGIELIYEDDACDTTKALSAYKRLTDVHNVRFIIGPSCGTQQKVLAPLFARNQQLAMLTSSSSEELFRLSKGRVFASQYSIEEESRYNAGLMNERGLKKALLVYFDNEFSRAHEHTFRQAFKGQVLESITFSALDAASMPAIALKIRQRAPDALYLPDVTPLLHGLLTQLRRLGLGELPVYSVYSAQMDEVIKVEGANAETLLYSYPDIAEQDAIAYFPALGARLFFQAIGHCSGEVDCTAAELKAKSQFNHMNILQSPLTLKTVRNGKFVEQQAR